MMQILKDSIVSVYNMACIKQSQIPKEDNIQNGSGSRSHEQRTAGI